MGHYQGRDRICAGNFVGAKMKLIQKRGNVFDVRGDTYFAHCIASDLAMGAGIAVQFQEKFHLRDKLRGSGQDLTAPTCILVGDIFNLITKSRSNGKPTSMSIRLAIRKMKFLIEDVGAERIVMPRIGCGLDRQSWAVIREILVEELDDVPVVIEVYQL